LPRASEKHTIRRYPNLLHRAESYAFMTIVQAPPRRPASRRNQDDAGRGHIVDPGVRSSPPQRRAPPPGRASSSILNYDIASLIAITVVAILFFQLTLVFGERFGSVLAMAATALALAAAIMAGIAYVTVDQRERLTWLAAWLGSGVIMLGLAMLAMDKGTLGSETQQWAERLLSGAVPLLLAAALLRVDGQLTTFRTLKLVADILVLGLTIVIGVTVISDADTMDPSRGVAVVESAVFASAYVCVAFGWIIVARPFLLRREITPPAAFAWGSVVMSCGACAQALAMVHVLPNRWIGIPFWIAGLGTLCYAGFLGARVDHSSDSRRTDAAKLFGSRLNLMPSIGAAGLLLIIWSTQATTLSSPSGAVYLASNVLAGLIVARLIITVCENTSLIAHIEGNIENEESFRDLGVALNSSLELQRVFQHVCKIGAVIMRADLAVLWLVDRRAQMLELTELVGRPREDFVGRKIPLSDLQSIAVRVVRSGQPEVIPYALGAHSSNPFLNTMFHTECLVTVPLTQQDHQPIGALVFCSSRNPTAFQERDVAKAEFLAVQAVVAMENARLYGEQHDRLQEMSALFQIAQAASRSQSAHELCDELLVILGEVVDYRSATVYLTDTSTGMLRGAVHDQRLPEGGRAPKPIGPTSLAAQVFEDGSPASARYDPPDFEASRALPPTRVRIAVPLLTTDGPPLGVVEVESHDPDAFGRTSVGLLTSLAQNAALAIANLRLGEEARQVAAFKELDRLKDELLATVSHELRTPLGSIKGYSTTLMKHSAKLNREEQQEFLTIIDEEADRLNELIGNLLDLSSLQAGMLSMRREPIRLGDIAQTAVNRASRRSEQHAVRLDWQSDPVILGDPKRMEQVFMNLLVNAIKYSPDGGLVSMGGWVEKGYLVVSVSDEGVGIPGSEVGRIFDRFHRVEGELKHRIGGTGLGLAICRRLIDAHQGKIWVESQLGKGSTFYISLPIHGKE
jgi:signal transduction histidine kinase